jgi:hypothetical protein
MSGSVDRLTMNTGVWLDEQGCWRDRRGRFAPAPANAQGAGVQPTEHGPAGHAAAGGRGAPVVLALALLGGIAVAAGGGSSGPAQGGGVLTAAIQPTPARTAAAASPKAQAPKAHLKAQLVTLAEKRLLAANALTGIGPSPRSFEAPRSFKAKLQRAKATKASFARLDAKAKRSRYCLIQLAYHEARSESRESIVKRLWTAVWRARRADFREHTICQAVFARYAFSAFNNGVPPMTNKAALKRVAAIVDSQLPAIMPEQFGGKRCVIYRADTDGTGEESCIATRADIVPKQPVITHYAEADCYYLGKPGYNYVQRNGRCEPKWAVKMVEVAAVPCTLVRHRECTTVFWRAPGNS